MQLKQLALVGLSVAFLQGCVAVAVVGIGAGASAAVDHRTIGTQIDDQQIELTAHSRLAKLPEIEKHTNLQVVSMNGMVLVVGQAPNSYLRDLAIKTINEVQGVEKIHNQIRIGNTTALTTQTNDLWLTSKAKAALFGSDSLEATNIKVVTENGEVFLMGLVTQDEAQEAVDIVRNISGVNRVFKMFEYI